METLTQDISWRRNAIALSDFIDLTDDVQLRFVASDSLRLDQELDSGSLIEAAVDDLVILDVVASDISEISPGSGIVAWPVPASDRIHAAGWQPGSQCCCWPRMESGSLKDKRTPVDRCTSKCPRACPVWPT